MKWDPWNDFKKDLPDPSIPVEAPPCCFCSNWKPQRKYMQLSGTGEIIYDGVRLCSAHEMENDFSCFKEKK